MQYKRIFVILQLGVTNIVLLFSKKYYLSCGKLTTVTHINNNQQIKKEQKNKGNMIKRIWQLTGPNQLIHRADNNG
jgi:hypothetical protein